MMKKGVNEKTPQKHKVNYHKNIKQNTTKTQNSIAVLNYLLPLHQIIRDVFVWIIYIVFLTPNYLNI